MTIEEKVRLWDAINEYVTAKGGDPGRIGVAAEKAVVAVEKTVDGIARAQINRALGEAPFSCASAGCPNSPEEGLLYCSVHSPRIYQWLGAGYVNKP